MAPLKVRKPSTWFLTSMGDIGHEAVPDEFLDRMFAMMARCPWHTFYVLTKRPGRLNVYLRNLELRAFENDCSGTDYLLTHCIDDAWWKGTGSDVPHNHPWPLSNVLIGCTAEDQTRADVRGPAMASIAAAGWRTFVSYEPALGPVDWSGWEFLSWLISGGESGQHARPSHPDWHRTARDWCAANGVPYLFKQWGEWTPGENVERQRGVVKTAFLEDDEESVEWFFSSENLAHCDGHRDDEPDLYRVGKKAAGRLLDGVEHNAFPKGHDHG